MTRSTRQPVYLQGAGIVSAAGVGMLATVQSLRGDGVEPGSVTIPRQGGDVVCPYYWAGWPELEAQARLTRLITTAADEALTQASLSVSERSGMAILVGTSSLDIGVWEDRYRDGLAAGSRYVPVESEYGALAQQVAAHVGSSGPQYLFNSACASSAYALLHASRLIAAGMVRHAMVVGVEFANGVSQSGFETLMLLSPDRLRPFASERNGVILGEGCGVVVLGAEPVADRFVEVLGGHANVDAEGLTAPTVNGAAATIQAALDACEVNRAEVTAIKTHGTATQMNDAAETAGMRMVFGERLPPITSLKPFFGHTLGACGTLELAAFSAALGDGFIPATPNFTGVDDELGVTPITALHRAAPGHYLLNHFGFGGANVSLVMSTRA